MIHELIGIQNNIVDLQGRDDVPDEMKKITLNADLDELLHFLREKTTIRPKDALR